MAAVVCDPEFGIYLPTARNKSVATVCFELCTENLGSESGSDASDQSLFSLLTPPPNFSRSEEKSGGAGFEQKRQSKYGEIKKMQGCASRSFPPPLTTMRGFKPMRVKPKREEGRLVIEALEEPAVCNYFRSERSHGRLRLCFWDKPCEDEEEEEEEDEEVEEEEVGEEEDGLSLMEDTIENNFNGGVKIGNQKFQRRSRCKEGDSCNSKGLGNWEPFLVAT